MESLDIQGQDRGEAGGIEVIEIEEEKFDTGAFRVNVWKAILARVFSVLFLFLFDFVLCVLFSDFLFNRKKMPTCLTMMNMSNSFLFPLS